MNEQVDGDRTSITTIKLDTYAHTNQFNSKEKIIETSNSELILERGIHANAFSADCELKIEPEVADFIEANIDFYRKKGASVGVIDGSLYADRNILFEIIDDCRKADIKWPDNYDIQNFFYRKPDHLWESFAESNISGSDVRQTAKTLRDLTINLAINENPDDYNYRVVLHEAEHALQTEEPTMKETDASINQYRDRSMNHPRAYSLAVKNPEIRKKKEEFEVDYSRLLSLMELDSIMIELENNDQGLPFSTAHFSYRLSSLLSEFKVISQFDFSDFDKTLLSLDASVLTYPVNEHNLATALLVLGEDYFDPTSNILINKEKLLGAVKSDQISFFDARNISGQIVQRIIYQVAQIEDGKTPFHIEDSFVKKVRDAIQMKAKAITTRAQDLYSAIVISRPQLRPLKK